MWNRFLEHELDKSSFIWVRFGTETLLLCIARSQQRCYGHLIRIPRRCLSLDVFYTDSTGGGSPGADRELAEGIIYAF